MLNNRLDPIRADFVEKMSEDGCNTELGIADASEIFFKHMVPSRARISDRQICAICVAHAVRRAALD